ncbi:tRNA 2-thiouridine(34) synthase MnmA [Puniceicoccus vermicola]|uniref:tRNA 2-thiouridine(34) synthase MnmA n=1 Tax=Puniceicoccus vermicola TaxID=388746 RepID=UPI0031B61191
MLVALSGGVDSSIAAALLQKRGYDVEGAYIRTWLDEEDLGECPAAQDIEDAEAVADHLGIPFRIVNLVRNYREKVVTYLVDGYRRGITPNPDIMCNREMKFGVFRDVARQEGFSHIATGHYCRSQSSEGQTRILEGIDKTKDQSYFLALTRGEDLQNVVFPVGDLRKAEVRELANEIGLPNARKKDSQGICFLGKVKIDEFLSRYIPDSPGDIVDTAGTVRGTHKGLHRFTIGQRRGIGVPSNTDNEAFVVVAKDLEKNQLVIGFDRPETPLLYQTGAIIGSLNWIGDPPSKGETLAAKPRYRDPAQEIQIIATGEGRIEVEFKNPQRALALGQILAFYRGEELIGGGTYEAVEHQKEFS